MQTYATTRNYFYKENHICMQTCQGNLVFGPPRSSCSPWICKWRWRENICQKHSEIRGNSTVEFGKQWDKLKTLELICIQVYLPIVHILQEWRNIWIAHLCITIWNRSLLETDDVSIFKLKHKKTFKKNQRMPLLTKALKKIFASKKRKFTNLTRTESKFLVNMFTHHIWLKLNFLQNKNVKSNRIFNFGRSSGQHY